MPDEMISIVTSGDTPDESPEVPDLEGAKIGADTDKSPQAAPSNSTPIESDVPLNSERGVDYTKLRD